jgi:hypothetical protein
MALELLWAIGCLISVEVPFPQTDCLLFYRLLLQYIDSESNAHVMHALMSCLLVTLSKLKACGRKSSSIGSEATQQHYQADMQLTVRSIINVLSRQPCDFSSIGHEQPMDYAGDAQGLRRQHRRLVGQLSVVQPLTLFELSLQIVSNCIDCVETASLCISFENGSLLTTLSKKLRDASLLSAAFPSIELAEKMTDVVCNSEFRHFVAVGEKFPADLIDPLHQCMRDKCLRKFFQETQRSHPASRVLHGAMVVPGLGDTPSMTLKQVSNLEESNGITVLGYAAATNLRDAVCLLLRLGADPKCTGSCGKDAMQMNVEHNGGSSEMLELLKSIKEVSVPSVKDSLSADHELCLRVTGKSSSELVSPIFDLLLDCAAATAHAEICFAIMMSLFNTILSAHPAILENLFVSIISMHCDHSPRATSTPDDTPSSLSESSAAEYKLRASHIAGRFFKLVRSIGKKFCKSSGVQVYASAGLHAIATLLKLPTSRPLARLCHKVRLVDPTLSELAFSTNVCTRAPAPSLHPRELDHEDEDGEGELSAGDVSPQLSVSSMMLSQSTSGASDESVAPARVSDDSRLALLLSEIRAILAAQSVCSADQSQTHHLQAIAHALNSAVFGTVESSPPNVHVSSATDAIVMLCDSLQVSSSCHYVPVCSSGSLKSIHQDGAFIEHLDSPQGCLVLHIIVSHVANDLCDISFARLLKHCFPFSPQSNLVPLLQAP